MQVDPSSIMVFSDSAQWEKWLEKNGKLSDGIWLRLGNKNSNLKTLSYVEAVDVALCFGWIDSLVHKYDASSHIQKFTPRRKRSIWSKINREKVERLIKEGKMRPTGLVQVVAAKKDGRWEAAYDSPTTSTIPEEFIKELGKHKKAKEFFATLNKSNLYAISWRLQTAKKPETRANRMRVIIEMLAKGEKFH
ncbi:YdeI/OmpD-associated family protein [Candidatus Woesebacteria bacterium]|jgi:uncharacterized protein YdeI (YjbR/CyaY-like superfamily)|nr:YdeI/OmpD-associated family protein [Candidatus Woesebacteria bacterium]